MADVSQPVRLGRSRRIGVRGGRRAVGARRGARNRIGRGGVSSGPWWDWRIVGYPQLLPGHRQAHLPRHRQSLLTLPPELRCLLKSRASRRDASTSEPRPMMSWCSRPAWALLSMARCCGFAQSGTRQSATCCRQKVLSHCNRQYLTTYCPALYMAWNQQYIAG